MRGGHTAGVGESFPAERSLGPADHSDLLTLGCHVRPMPTCGVVDPQVRFEAVYAAHNAAVRAYVRRRVDSQDADDVVADVFVIAWRRLGDVPDDPLPWLLGVTRRVMANRWRGATRAAALRRCGTA